MTKGDIRIISAWMESDPHWQRYAMTRESIERELGWALERHDLLLVADIERPARGFAWCCLNGMFGSHAYLKRIGVDPEVTGHQIGSQLLAEIEQFLQEANRKMLYLLVSDFNERARRFYERSGYHKIGEFPDLALPGVTELLYSKDLGGLA